MSTKTELALEALIKLTELISPEIKFKFDVLNDGINCCVVILEFMKPLARAIFLIFSVIKTFAVFILSSTCAASSVNPASSKLLLILPGQVQV